MEYEWAAGVGMLEVKGSVGTGSASIVCPLQGIPWSSQRTPMIQAKPPSVQISEMHADIDQSQSRGGGVSQGTNLGACFCMRDIMPTLTGPEYIYDISCTHAHTLLLIARKV